MKTECSQMFSSGTIMAEKSSGEGYKTSEVSF